MCGRRGEEREVEGGVVVGLGGKGWIRKGTEKGVEWLASG